jgi:TolA-binding protein
MPTAKDCTNRLIETVNVGYDDRITNQECKFINPNNIYKGSFTGNIDSLSGTLIDAARISIPRENGFTELASYINDLNDRITELEENLSGLINQQSSENTEEEIEENV